MKPTLSLVVMIVVAIINIEATAGWQDIANDLGNIVIGTGEQTNGSQNLQGLAQQEMIEGLKEALMVGGQRTIRALGRSGGFLSNPKVRISVPDRMKLMEQGLRLAGQGQVVDDLIGAMNRAAEQAVPEAAGLFGDAIQAMSWQDVQSILEGPDDAATRYFQNYSGKKLSERMLPIIKNSTNQVGVASYYKKVTGGIGLINAFSGREALALDLDRYITDKAMDGLFLRLAEEEGRIREDPAARSTDLLKKIFGR